jgi:ubiquinone/menaquinone biosynthesis C-methylase UbiE
MESDGVTPREEEVFFQIHTGLDREGPGSRQSTGKAFSCIRGLPPNPGILDIGCGPGTQTVQLAELSGGEISPWTTTRPSSND